MKKICAEKVLQDRIEKKKEGIRKHTTFSLSRTTRFRDGN